MMRNRLVQIAEGVVTIFALLIAIFVTTSSFLYRIAMADNSIYADRPFLLLMITAAAFLVVSGIITLVTRDEKRAQWIERILFAVLLALDLVFCYWWIVNASSYPSSDGKAVYDIAKRFIEGDMTAVAPEGSYLSLWPFQSGFLMYVQLIIRLFPEDSILALGICNLISVGVGIFSLRQVVHLWTEDVRVLLWSDFCVAFCLPYLFYVNFIYNDIISLGFLLAAAWAFTAFWKKGGITRAILGVLLAGGAMALRGNSAIFVVAVALLCTVMAIQTGKWKEMLFLTLGLSLIAVVASKAPQKYYEYRAQNTMGDGVPAISYIAMGLQDSGQTAGWWNGYHHTTYMDTEYDADATAIICRASIAESLEKFVENPGYMLDFFYRKLVPEWSDEDYSALYVSVSLYGERTNMAHAIYEGAYTGDVQNLMNDYQAFLYFGFFLYTVSQLFDWIRHLRKKKAAEGVELYRLLLLVTIIGGFLFEIFWEGSARYVLPYAVMMTVYAGMGYAGCQRGIISLIQKKHDANKLSTE